MFVERWGHAEWNRNRGWTRRFWQNRQNALLKPQYCICFCHAQKHDAMMLLSEDTLALALRVEAGFSTCMHWGPCSVGWSGGMGGQGAGKKGQGGHWFSLHHHVLAWNSKETQNSKSKPGLLKGHRVKVAVQNVFHATSLLPWFIIFSCLNI